MIPSDCNDTNDDVPCILQDDTVKGEQSYNNVIDQQPSILFSNIGEYEGYGWGPILSTSGKSQLHSEMSDNSVTLILGKGRTSYRKYVKGNNDMVMSNKATNILLDNPETFLTIYGPYYVKELHYGGSYFGYHNIAKKSYQAANDTAFFAKYDINNVFFSRGGSKNFTTEA